MMSIGSRIVGDGFAEIVKALGPTTWKREKKGFDEALRQSRAWDEKGSKSPAGETPFPFLVRAYFEPSIPAAQGSEGKLASAIRVYPRKA